MDRSVQNADGNCQLIMCEQSVGEVSINCNFCCSIILQKTPLFYCARNIQRAIHVIVKIYN